MLLLDASLFAVPFYAARMLLTVKYRKSLSAKFGRLAPELLSRLQGTPRIWIHAVLVGEVTAAAPIVEALRARFPGVCLVLSTSTETGGRWPGSSLARRASIYITPSISPSVVRKVVGLVNPDVFVPVETELWPNFIRICRGRGTRIISFACLILGSDPPMNF